MNHSVIFTQICSKVTLNTKWGKIKPMPETSTFKYPKWKFASEIEHFVILPKLTQNFIHFQKKQSQNRKMSKIKTHN